MSGPRHVIAPEPRLRVGQRWQDTTTSLETADDVITVRDVDPANETVRGTYRRGGAAAEGAGVWPFASFANFCLLTDTIWPVFRIAGAVDVLDPRTDTVRRGVGRLVGQRSTTLPTAARPHGGPECCWAVVAPTAEEARALVVQALGPDVEVRPAPGWTWEL